MTVPLSDYAVRTRDERDDTLHYDIRPSLVMAQDSRDLVREAYADGGTYHADAEVVARPEGTTEWVVLSDEDISRIIADAWKGLDQAVAPVVAAGLAQLAGQQRTDTRPYVAPGTPAGAPERAREIAETMPTVGQWPGPESAAPRMADPIDAQPGDVWHDEYPTFTGGTNWHARADEDGNVELFEPGGPGLIPASQVCKMRGGMTLVSRVTAPEGDPRAELFNPDDDCSDDESAGGDPRSGCAITPTCTLRCYIRHQAGEAQLNDALVDNAPYAGGDA
jgi:hypothetical protein